MLFFEIHVLIQDFERLVLKSFCICTMLLKITIHYKNQTLEISHISGIN